MDKQSSMVHFLRSIRHALVAQSARFRRTGALVFATVALLSAALCALPFLPVHTSVSEGTVVDADMISRRDIVYVDSAKTLDLRKRASDEVAPIYKFDGTRLPAALTAFEDMMTKVIAIRGQDVGVSLQSERIAALLMTSAGTTTKYLATCSESEVQSSKTAARQALATVMGRGVLEGSVAAARESINAELKKYGISDSQVRSAYLLAVRLVSSNLMYDQEATLLAREKAASLVSPVVSTIIAGTSVVKRGTVLDQGTIDLLLSTGLIWGPRAFRNLLSRMLVALAIWGIVALTIVLLDSPRVRTQHLFMEAGVIGGSCIVIGWLASGMAPTMTPFFLCMLLGLVFFDGALATVFGLALIVVTWVMVPMPAEVLSGLVVGAVSVLVVMRKANKMSALLIAGPVAGVTAGLIYGA
ncbi:MAG TPA: hypothetical protein VN478_04785, partial [Clostridia bacterium]|nr:hypothetical protein [Clostridia bacterium]